MQNNVTEMFLIMPSTTIAQMVPLRKTKGPTELYIRKFQTALPPKQLVYIQNNFTDIFLIMPSLHIWFLSASDRDRQSSK